MENSTETYIAHRVETAINRNGESVADFVRNQAMIEAQQYEAMGSTYDPESRTWSPITVRVKSSQTRKNFGYAVDSIKATKGILDYDHDSHVWTISGEGFTGMTGHALRTEWVKGTIENV